MSGGEKIPEEGRLLLFRGNTAFGKPEVYEYLEQEKIGYAVRLSANAILQKAIAHLLVRPAEWASKGPIVSYHDFTYQAQSWSISRRVVAKSRGIYAFSCGVRRVGAPDAIRRSNPSTPPSLTQRRCDVFLLPTSLGSVQGHATGPLAIR